MSIAKRHKCILSKNNLVDLTINESLDLIGPQVCVDVPVRELDYNVISRINKGRPNSSIHAERSWCCKKYFLRGQRQKNHYIFVPKPAA